MSGIFFGFVFWGFFFAINFVKKRVYIDNNNKKNLL